MSHEANAGSDGRRKGDRREAQMPFEGPERRQGERRSGVDRRAKPRLRNAALQAK